MPPPWLELTTSDPSVSATRVSPPGTILHAVGARQHEGPQIDVARRNAAVERGRAGRQRQRRLGDVIGRIGLQLGGEHFALRGAGVRADQHAVAARAVDLLDHQLVEPFEHDI